MRIASWLLLCLQIILRFVPKKVTHHVCVKIHTYPSFKYFTGSAHNITDNDYDNSFYLPIGILDPYTFHRKPRG